MLHCDLTLPTPAENLACDEALLDLCESGRSDELLRFWEPSQYFVVLGYANRAASEVNLSYCHQNDIPVLRRCTGGGTVLQGPGCLNYSLVLRIAASASLQSIPATNDFILQRNQLAFAAALNNSLQRHGQTDLTMGGLKFSGNAQRRRKNFLIFHGTLLLNLDLSLVEKALPLPARQPAYRANRSHIDFMTNLRVPAGPLKDALRQAWNACEPLAQIPFELIHRLAKEKYELDSWNLKF